MTFQSTNNKDLSWYYAWVHTVIITYVKYWILPWWFLHLHRLEAIAHIDDKWDKITEKR